jgi:hypothetical protein
MIDKKFLSSLNENGTSYLFGKSDIHFIKDEHIFSLGLKRETPEEFYDRP